MHFSSRKITHLCLSRSPHFMASLHQSHQRALCMVDRSAGADQALYRILITTCFRRSQHSRKTTMARVPKLVARFSIYTSYLSYSALPR
jgi:hypothetical protein